MPNPIRIGYSGLTNRIFALRRYTERSDGTLISQTKDEVTAEAVHAVLEHVRADAPCPIDGCECEALRIRANV
jgi:hypothetical protein